MSDTITLSSGVTFRLAPLQPLFYQAYVSKLEKELPMPEMPKILTKTMENPEGEWLLNPSDPDYQRAIQIRQNTYGDKMLDALIIMGLEVDLPKDASWLDKLKYLGVDINENSPEGLKVAYVRFVALRTVQDIQAITDAILRQVTVTEGAVTQATTSFRGKV